MSETDKLNTDKIPNTDLSGPELVSIIADDVRDMLSRDGMFAKHIGYGRVSYVVTVKLKLDNPAYPEHMNTIRSRADKNTPAIQPAAGTEPVIKEPTKDALKIGRQRERKITSPNVERVTHEMPIIQESIDQQGKVARKELRYPKDAVAGQDKHTNTLDKDIESAWDN